MQCGIGFRCATEFNKAKPQPTSGQSEQGLVTDYEEQLIEVLIELFNFAKQSMIVVDTDSLRPMNQVHQIGKGKIK